MVALGLVRDPEAKEPAPELAKAGTRAALQRGLILLRAGVYANCVRVLCPLTISEAELEEGLEARWARHRANAETLWDGLEAMGLTLHVADPERRVPSLTTVRVPDGIDEAAVRARLREEYGIEIGAGLGPLKGRVWRIGLMGHGSQRANVLLLLAALVEILGGR